MRDIIPMSSGKTLPMARSGIRTLLLILLVVSLPACGSGPGAEASGGAAATGGGGQTVRVDLDAIFPAGEGRDLVLNNCQSCHTWVPIVVLQMQEDEWYRWSIEHRTRVSGLSDEQFDTLYRYLVANFNPQRPVPELPPALLESWTSY
jgi:mono/diheme cytochrome c family protein